METTNYGMAVFGTTGHLSYDSTEEQKRFVLIDALLSIFTAGLGKGVIGGLGPASGYTAVGTKLVKLATGTVLVPGVGGTPALWGSVSAAQGLVGVDLTDYPAVTDYVIYVQATINTATTGAVEFHVADTLPSQGVLIATVSTLGTDGAISDLTFSLNTSLFVPSAARSAIYEHTHDNVSAPFIDLTSDVTGTLSVDNLPDIPASKIQGIVPTEQFTVSHSDLLDTGVYTHPQLDSFYNSLQLSGNIDTYKSMSLINLRNRLTLGIEFHKIYSNPDVTYINEVYVIPSSDFLNLNAVDTTATYDAGLDAYIGAVGTTVASATWHAVWGGDNLSAANTEYLAYADSLALSTTQADDVVITPTLGTDYESVGLAMSSTSAYILTAGVLTLRYDAVAQATFNSIDLTLGIPTGTSIKVEACALDNVSDVPTWVEVSGSPFTATQTATNVAASYANKRYLDIRFTLLTTSGYSTFTPSVEIVSLNWTKTTDLTSTYVYPSYIETSSTLTNVFVTPLETTDANTRFDYRVGTSIDQTWDSATPIAPNVWCQTFPASTAVFVIAKLTSGSLTNIPAIYGYAYQFHTLNKDIIPVYSLEPLA